MPVGTAVTLAKATLTVRPDTAGGVRQTSLRCRYNPRELTVAKSATWRPAPNPNSPTSPSDFISANPRTLSMELFFDAWESLAGDVSRDVDTVLSWVEPTPASAGGPRPNPPILIVHWGAKTYDNYYLSSVSARYTMFRRDGTPVRAHVNVTLNEVPPDRPRTNPTSGGPAGRRTRAVESGDTLQSIAYREYRDPRLWRALALANAIDDPMRLEPGRSLLVPTLAAATDLLAAR